MKKLRVYLDTSVINFLFADDAPDYRAVTEDFFANTAGRYDLFISRTVEMEIMRDPDPDHRALLEEVLSSHPISLLPDEPLQAIGTLAAAYMRAGIVPLNKTDDALHVAYATVHEMDVLLSWNFKHLANVRRESRFLAVNQDHGYRHPMRLASPLELEDEDE